MVCYTGDIHGNPYPVEMIAEREHLLADDVIIILGDVGANYYLGEKDNTVKARLNRIGVQIFCIHGNHEIRPIHVPGYREQEWNGGIVWVQPEYPNLLFAKDGEIYTIDGLKYLVIGGAYSVDKYYRIAYYGYGWWEDEQPSDETKNYVEKQIHEKEFDIILSHTCPYKYEPKEMFLAQIDQSTVDDSTERWLDTIEESADYLAWFCGHWHTDKRIDKMHFLLHGYETDEQFK